MCVGEVECTEGNVNLLISFLSSANIFTPYIESNNELYEKDKMTKRMS